MKVFYPIALAIIAANSNANATPMMRGLHRGGGRGKHCGRPFIQDMICPSEEECAAIVPGLNCNIERPERPDFSLMTSEEDKQVAWSELKAARKVHREQVVNCVCCTDATLEELLPRDEDWSPGSGHGHGHGGMHGGRPLIQDMMEEECPTEEECDATDTGIACTTERPERPDFSLLALMSEEEKQVAWSELKAARKVHREQVRSCVCCTDATLEDFLPGDEDWSLGFGHGHGHGHGGRQFFQEMIEDKCPTEEECEAIDTDIACTTERPECPDFSLMTSEEEKQEAWSELKAARKVHREQVVNCVCCTEATLEDMFPQGTSSGDGVDGDSSMDGFRGDGRGDGMFGGRGDGHGHGHGHGKFGEGRGDGHMHGKFGGTGDGHGMKIQFMLDEHCPMFENNGGCAEPDSTCIQLDSTSTREERRENALHCVCCLEDGVSELEDINGVEASVLLSSLLKDEAVVQTEESFLNSPANRSGLSMASAFAAVGVVLVMV